MREGRLGLPTGRFFIETSMIDARHLALLGAPGGGDLPSDEIGSDYLLMNASRVVGFPQVAKYRLIKGD